MAAASPSSELLKASRRAGAAGESGKAGGGGLWLFSLPLS